MSPVQHWAIVGAVSVWLIVLAFGVYHRSSDKRCPVWLLDLSILGSLIGMAMAAIMWGQAIDAILEQAVNSGRLAVPFP